LYCGTHGLLKDVPLDKVREFESEFLRALEMKHRKDVLDVLKEGKLDKLVEKIIESVAADTAAQYKK